MIKILLELQRKPIASMNEGNLEMFHFIHTFIDAQW